NKGTFSETISNVSTRVFIQILEKALLNPHTHYFLVIEELNRANTAAVFGEIFQLLDRDKEGKSEYPILIQDEDLF
ncbi:hypothetical protein ACT453_60225, partial [Bacillus sp. D-CC]